MCLPGRGARRPGCAGKGHIIEPSLCSSVAGTQASTDGEGSPSRDQPPSVTTQSFPESAIGDWPLAYGVDVSRTSSHQ